MWFSVVVWAILRSMVHVMDRIHLRIAAVTVWIGWLLLLIDWLEEEKMWGKNKISFDLFGALIAENFKDLCGELGYVVNTFGGRLAWVEQIGIADI